MLVIRAAVCLSGIAALFVQHSPFGYDAPSLSYAVAALLSVAVLLAVMFAPRRNLWSAGSAYLFIFWLFHFGLIASIGLGDQSAGDVSEWNSRWVYTPAAVDAVWLCMMAMLAYVMGLTVGSWRKDPERDRAEERAPSSADKSSRRATIAGVLIVFASCGAWFYLVLRAGGASLLLGSYSEYLNATEGDAGVITWIWFGLGIGAVVVLTAPKMQWRSLGRGVLLVFSLFALPLGLRGELLFPFVSAAVVRYWQGRPFSGLKTGALAVIGLLGIALIKEIRSVGLTGFDFSSATASPLSGLEELGGSLQPVERVIAWRTEGDELIMGASYWAPFDRAIARVIPGLSRPPAEQDDRIMNVLVTKRIGTIGFSPVAEAYRNFGRMGVIGVMALLGYLMALLDRTAVTFYRQLLGAVVYVTLLINVRNSFINVPAHIAIGLAAVALVYRGAYGRRTRIVGSVQQIEQGNRW